MNRAAKTILNILIACGVFAAFLWVLYLWAYVATGKQAADQHLKDVLAEAESKWPEFGFLRIAAWNVESGGNDPDVIVKQLHDRFESFDMVSLCEVSPSNRATYTNYISMPKDQEFVGFIDGFFEVLSESGGDDRLLVLHKNRFDVLQQYELDQHGKHVLNDGLHRSPLVVRFREGMTLKEFILVTVHLARGDVELRKEQAIGLREWARDQTLPVIAIGDFNFDYNFETKQGNEAFDEFTKHSVWKWIKPEEFIDTNWSDRDGDGVDDYPGSMRDFAFVAGPAKDWNATFRVIVTDSDFPDDERTSDHRPIELLLRMSKPTKEDIRRALDDHEENKPEN